MCEPFELIASLRLHHCGQRSPSLHTRTLCTPRYLSVPCYLCMMYVCDGHSHSHFSACLIPDEATRPPSVAHRAEPSRPRSFQRLRVCLSDSCVARPGPCANLAVQQLSWRKLSLLHLYAILSHTPPRKWFCRHAFCVRVHIFSIPCFMRLTKVFIWCLPGPRLFHFHCFFLSLCILM